MIALPSIPTKVAETLHLRAVQQLWRRPGFRQSAVAGEFSEILDGETDHPVSIDTEPEPRHWSEWRINLMERLWGQGFLLPGGTEFVDELTKPLALGSKASVLILNAGMGGPANLIAEEFGAFIDGIESDPELAAASEKRAQVVKGMSRVTIKNLAIDDDTAFERKYDAIFAQEILLQLTDKPKLLANCIGALKKNGKLVLTDFTRPDGAATSAQDLWLKREAAAGPTLDEAELRVLFKDAGFSMRTIEDMTDQYVGLVLDGWVALEQSLRANAANRDILLGMIEEAERWAVRVTLLKANQIRYTRIFATKKTVF